MLTVNNKISLICQAQHESSTLMQSFYLSFDQDVENVLFYECASDSLVYLTYMHSKLVMIA